jgi:hypothetical protein
MAQKARSMSQMVPSPRGGGERVRVRGGSWIA